MAIKSKKKIVLLSALAAGVAIGSIAGLSVVKSKKPFKPVVMNYEAYMSDATKRGIEKNFSYREFGDVSEFSKAIEDNRTIGGIGSDFQIARMAQKQKLRKIDYGYLFKTNEKLSSELSFEWTEEEKRMTDSVKKAEKRLSRRRAAIEELFRKETIKHMDNFNSFMYVNGDLPKDDSEKNKNILDVDNDGIQDQLWEFMIPYYIQDKVLAYSVGEKTNKPAFSQIDKDVIEKLRNSEFEFKDQTVAGIASTLRSQGYKYFEWTEAMRDNMIAGSETIALKANDTKLYTGVVNKENYISQIDGFLELINKSTGADISDTTINTFKSSGGEMLDGLINPDTKQEVGFLYNGDALDALNGSDNYEIHEDGSTIRAIRPKNNLTLLDGFIVTNIVDDNMNKTLLDTMYDSLYKGEEMELQEIFSNVVNPIKYVKTKDENGNDKEELGIGITLDLEKLPSLNNFDLVNYTPAFKKSFEFIEKFYFNDFTKEVFDENGDSFNILIDENGNPISDIHDFDKIKTQVKELSNRVAKNLFHSQPEYQLTNGLRTEEEKTKNELEQLVKEGKAYKVNYQYISPVSESLQTLVRGEYVKKTKN